MHLKHPVGALGHRASPERSTLLALSDVTKNFMTRHKSNM